MAATGWFSATPPRGNQGSGPDRIYGPWRLLGEEPGGGATHHGAGWRLRPGIRFPCGRTGGSYGPYRFPASCRSQDDLPRCPWLGPSFGGGPRRRAMWRACALECLVVVVEEDPVDDEEGVPVATGAGAGVRVDLIVQPPDWRSFHEEQDALRPQRALKSDGRLRPGDPSTATVVQADEPQHNAVPPATGSGCGNRPEPALLLHAQRR